MRILLLLLFLLGASVIPGFATHIVGGEFEMQNLGNYRYRLTLNLYFDNVSGSPGALDTAVTAVIYPKSSDQFLDQIRMRLKSETMVAYTNPDCAVGALSTKKLIYWQEFELDPGLYEDPAGYYIVWQRCCRNQGISNIIDPGLTGQTFYMEFPPIRVNGQPNINSSPVLFPPLSDYACVNNLFYFDFSGTDPDGDSLAYKMVTPLHGGSEAIPTPQIAQPTPHDPVIWNFGFNVNNQITGPEPLNINPVNGLLRVVPNQLGLFVFSVKCEEFRNGVKIGEVRRDFQLMVLDCPSNVKPDIVAQSASTPGTNYVPGTVLQIGGGDSRCLNLIMTDFDPTELLTVTAYPVNFTPPAGFGLNTTGVINNIPDNDTLLVSFCMPRCLPQRSTPYLLDIIVKDDGCSVPKQDTIRISFNYTSIVNNAPAVTTTQPGNVVNATVGDMVNFNVTGTDPDGGLVVLSAEGVGFNLASLGINFPNLTVVGTVTGPFSWQVPCEAFHQSPFVVNFIVRDTMCIGDKSHTIPVTFNIAGLPNQAPEISDPADQTIEIGAPPISFPITGTDLNPSDQLELIMSGNGFDPSALGMQFNTQPSTSPVQGTFSWSPTCSVPPGTYEVWFIVRDIPCNVSETDTTKVRITVTYNNAAPAIAGDPEHESPVGVPVQVPFSAQDPDNDQFTVTIDAGGLNPADYGIEFTPVVSTDGQPRDGEFTWTPNCLTAALPDDVRIWLVVTDNSCPPGHSDRQEFILKTNYTNEAPVLSFQLPDDAGALPPEPIEIEIGQELVFDIIGTDADNHLLALNAAGTNFELASAGIQFTPDSNPGSVKSTFSWTPECSKGGPGTYTIQFGLDETTCIPENKAGTVVVRVVDVKQKEVFIPANIFTPNGDGVNDVFEFPALPPNTCDNKFVQMVLFNRWGGKVYSSPSRTFRWDGGDAPAGIYFYQLEFEKKTYKGYVTLVR